MSVNINAMLEKIKNMGCDISANLKLLIFKFPKHLKELKELQSRLERNEFNDGDVESLYKVFSFLLKKIRLYKGYQNISSSFSGRRIDLTSLDNTPPNKQENLGECDYCEKIKNWGVKDIIKQIIVKMEGNAHDSKRTERN